MQIQENFENSEKFEEITKITKIRENQEFRGTLTQLDAIWSLFCGTPTFTHPHPQLLGLRQYIGFSP